MKIVLVHGFNVRDGGRRSIDQLADSLRRRGHTVDTDTADYGWHGLIKVRFFHGSAVRRIRAALMSADAVITHSNGANYATKALKKINSKKIVVHISPALNKRSKPPKSVGTQHVFHTRHDNAVQWGKYVLFHPWGNMGAYGYAGKDNRVTNHDYTNRVKGHSDWFRNGNTSYFAGVISNLLKDSV